MEHAIYSTEERPESARQLPLAVDWPRFIGHDPAVRELMPKAQQAFPDLNLVLVDEHDTVIGNGWAVSLTWDRSVPGLPNGWDDALERSINEHDAGTRPTAICLMGAEVIERHRGFGLGSMLIQAVVRLATIPGNTSSHRAGAPDAEICAPARSDGPLHRMDAGGRRTV